MRALDDLEPLGAGGCVDDGQAMVEEMLDGGGFGLAVVGDEPDQSRADISNACLSTVRCEETNR